METQKKSERVVRWQAAMNCFLRCSALSIKRWGGCWTEHPMTTELIMARTHERSKVGTNTLHDRKYVDTCSLNISFQNHGH